jgi:hypothetical protein
VIDVKVAVDVEADLKIIVDLLVSLSADVKVGVAAGVSFQEIHTCGSIFVLLVNLLVSILIKIMGSCHKGKRPQHHS